MQTASKHLPHRYSLRSTFIGDLSLIPISFIVCFTLSCYFNLSEQYAAWASHLESTLNVDELPLACLAMLTTTVWFSWRRWMEIRLLLKQNHMLLQHATRMQESERRKIAQDLHDELGQYLNAIRLESASLKAQATNPEKVQMIANHISEHASHAYHMAKQLMYRLRPVALDDLGLCAALNHLINTWQTSSNTSANHATVYKLKTYGDIDRIPEEIAIDIYRIVQEGLTNATRHAHAHHIDIDIQAFPGHLSIQIKDDGIGFNPYQTNNGLGVAGVRERVESHQGTFNINSKLGDGCHLSITIPLQNSCPQQNS
jgi:signal transduction histidine kinase